MLCPGQEKDDLKINRDPPMDLNSELQRGGHNCPSLGAPQSLGGEEEKPEGAVGGVRRSPERK